MTEENEKNTNEEPSIEEILSSIRDIISDEDEDDGAVDATDKPTETTVDAPTSAEDKPVEAGGVTQDGPVADSDVSEKDEDDVLDLAEFAKEGGVVGDVEDDEPEVEVDVDDSATVAEDDIAAIMAEDDNNDPLAGIDFDHPTDDDFDMVDTTDEADDGVSDILDDEKETLVEGLAETATIGAMAKLAENISLSRTSDGVTLEDIVQELLRPMLKGWLDENLPTLIDRLVSEELERLTQKAMRK